MTSSSWKFFPGSHRPAFAMEAWAAAKIALAIPTSSPNQIQKTMSGEWKEEKELAVAEEDHIGAVRDILLLQGNLQQYQVGPL